MYLKQGNILLIELCMRKIILLGICFLVCNCVFAQGVKFDTLSLEQALTRAQAEGKLVFVDVTASWCGPCQLMLEEVLNKKEVGEFCNEQFVCIQMDIDKLEGKDFKKKYGVKSIPAFFILQKDGVVRHRLQGSRNPEDFLAWAKRGVNETSSLFFLNSLLGRKQEMNLQNMVDYYLVLKDIRKLHEADSVREVLFGQVPFEKLIDKECWPLFNGDAYGGKYFEFVVKHGDKFRQKQGKDRIDDYLVQGYKREIQRLMYECQASPEAFSLIDQIKTVLSDSGRNIISEEDKVKIVLTWAEEVKAFLENDISGMVEGMQELVELKEWRDCLWHAMKYVGLNGKDEDKERMGQFTSKMLFEFSNTPVEQWDFYQKFRFLGFPISCNEQFWINALEQMEEKNKPLLLECVKGNDAYFITRNWAWDLPERVNYLDSLCVSVRIDMDDPDVAFLKERFEITNYPAYFLLDKEGKVRYSWEGMIEEDQAFRDSLRKGLKGI